MILKVNNISKSIKKNKLLNGISLELESGKVYGFVGRNGSGKTMLFRAISGMIKVDEGTIEINDKVLHKDFDVLPGLGMLLENADMFPNKTGLDNLLYLSMIRKQIGEKEARGAMMRVGLNPDEKKSYRKYSLGMKQKLRIAQAIMEQNDVLIFDEPTNGLDREAVEKFKTIVEEEKKRGAMVLLASHNKEEIEFLSDMIFTLDAGQIV